MFYLSTTYMQEQVYQCDERLQLYHGLPQNCSERKKESVYVALYRVQQFLKFYNKDEKDQRNVLIFLDKFLK